MKPTKTYRSSDVAMMLLVEKDEAARLAEENERLRALLVAALDAIQPIDDGKRDGGTFGRLSQVSDEIRAALAS